jgi:hypothetical protein
VSSNNLRFTPAELDILAGIICRLSDEGVAGAIVYEMAKKTNATYNARAEYNRMYLQIYRACVPDERNQDAHCTIHRGTPGADFSAICEAAHAFAFMVMQLRIARYDGVPLGDLVIPDDNLLNKCLKRQDNLV